jgi:hypothetical protein
VKDIHSRLTIQYGATFTDVSDSLSDFAVDNATITLLNTDSLWVGFEKPISSLFFYLTTPSTSARKVTVSMFNANINAWDVVQSSDDTAGFTRSGFLSWILPDQISLASVNTVSQYWVKINVDTSTTAMVVRAVSALFSDDRELKKEFPSILNSNFLLGGTTDHYLIHETCRNDIVQYFRKKGLRRLGADAIRKKFMAFDIMDIDEVRTAATYLALSKIFSNVANSANEEDNWLAKSRKYKKMSDEALNTAYLTWDHSSDGAKNEQDQIANITLHR